MPHRQTFLRQAKNMKLWRVEKLQAANPDMDETAIPVDLVTCSGSGLDPHVSPAAAEYQVARIAKADNMTEDEVREIIDKCYAILILSLSYLRQLNTD